MYSIVDNKGKCVGQYIFIKDDKYSTRLFTRFYNMCINKEDHITEDVVQDLIRMNKYDLENSIHIYDLQTDIITLKQLEVGSVMIYMNEKNRLYLASEDELDKLLEDNNYTTIKSIAYVLGIPDVHGFKLVRPISSNNLENAKRVYKKRYNIEQDPIFIGIKEFGHLYISLNNHLLVAEIDEEVITKSIEQ